MKKRPRAFLFCAFCYSAVAIGLPAQLLFIYERPLSEVEVVFHQLTYLNWIVLCLSLICSVLVFRASQWSLYLVPLLIAFVGINNFFVGYWSIDYSAETAMLATLGFVAINLPLLRPKLVVLFKNPSLRWWLTPKRKRILLPVLLGSTRQISFRAETLDISETGLFVAVKETSSEQAKKLKPKDPISICLNLGAMAQLRCDGRVIRQVPGSANTQGIGIQFEQISASERRRLRRFLSSVSDAGVVQLDI